MATSIRTRRATLSPAPGPTLVRCRSATRPRRDGSVRGFPTNIEDMNIFKVFPVKERLKMRFEAEFGRLQLFSFATRTVRTVRQLNKQGFGGPGLAVSPDGWGSSMMRAATLC